MATSMELLQQGERFRIIDPPSLPIKPSFPDRLKFCGIGLLVGLALGAVVAGGVEMMDDRVYNERELKGLLPVSVLWKFPLSVVQQPKAEQKKVWLGWAPQLWYLPPSWQDPRLAIWQADFNPDVQIFFQSRTQSLRLTPDPFFLFSTPRHNEALATLYHGVRGHKGFVVLTGEVGTGKTLLLRCLLQLLRQSNDVAYAYVFNSRLSPVEFLQYIARDFGLPASGRNKSEILFDLSNYVIARGSRKLTTVLVVDEAHHLSADILEEIRLLTNLETTQEKLLQVLLVGQPELNDKLDSAALRQLKSEWLIAHS